jgi:hypothetical protein
MQAPQQEAAALSEARGLDVWVAPWYHLTADERRGVTLSSPGYRAVGGDLVERSEAPPERFDAVLCYAVEDNAIISPKATAVEQEACARLGGEPRRLEIVLNCLRAAATAGQITNLERGDLELDNKVTCAMYFDERASAGRANLRRPHTLVCHRDGLANTVASLPAGDAKPYIIKPAGGTRGERIALARNFSPHDPLYESENYWVVQELLADPWIVDERKADVRIYAIVDTRSRRRSVVTDARMVRLCALPHQAGVLETEIASNSMRRKLKLPPATYPLDGVPSPPAAREAVRQATTTAAEQFLDVYFEWLADRAISDTTSRILLWGIDFFIDRHFNASFIEANFYPFLFQFPENCRPAIRAMLAGPYGGALQAAMPTLEGRPA